MNPCHCHLAVPPFIVEASGVCLTRKLVEIVSHAAELADVSGMFLRQPFFHMTVTETFPHGEKQDKTAASDYKNDCYKYLIYSQYILTNEETGYWRLVLIGVNLYHSCTSPEGSHGSISFQQRATAFNSVQINFFDDGPSK